MGGIIRELGGKSLAINGTKDHVHLLFELPHRLSVADVMRVVKTNSSRWIHEKWPQHANFAWQTGYAAFSVSHSNARAVARYIREQEIHHNKIGFERELRSFLKKHEIAYDEQFLFRD